MSLDNTNIAFSSTWDIDQIVSTGTTTVSSGDSLVAALPSSPALPVFMLQFQPTGSSYWYQAGTNITESSTNEFTFYGYIQSATLRINTTKAGTARYFIWTDKLNY